MKTKESPRGIDEPHGWQSCRKREKMREGIHPTYHKAKVVCTSCGAEFETGSVLSEIKVDTCSNCHPFYTGRQRFAQAQGRIEKFNK